MVGGFGSSPTALRGETVATLPATSGNHYARKYERAAGSSLPFCSAAGLRRQRRRAGQPPGTRDVLLAAPRVAWTGTNGTRPSRTIQWCSKRTQLRRGVLRRAGSSYADKGEIQGIKDLSEAIRRDPKRARAFLNRGRAYVRVGQSWLAPCRTWTRRCVLIRPRPGYSFRVSALMAEGEWQRAVADADEVIRLAPKDVSGYVFRARRGTRRATTRTPPGTPLRRSRSIAKVT